MKAGPVLTAVVAAGAMIAVISAFAANASPYVTFEQARQTGGDRLHVVGEVVKGSINVDYLKHTMSFRLKDSDGTVMTVNHTGDMPNNLSQAPKVVAVGELKGEQFVSSDLILKCPSKYEKEEK
ncbi:hypothetical protein EON81_19470 [bacterium]|nr:MAG: hypothetical protein EON81_19470 [bacterium]